MMTAQQPPQTQSHQPGRETLMRPRPDYEPFFPGVGKLADQVALISGGDSGIGRAIAVAMAREGAKISIVYLEEHEDAAETARAVKREGSQCMPLAGDIGDPAFCRKAVTETVEQFGGLDILVNNAAEQHETEDFTTIPVDQIERTFRTNIFSMFFLSREAVKYMGEGATIINTASVTAYQGHKTLIDYASTKGAIVSFTRSLAQILTKQRIRVNAVAPGPVWTPLIPSSFSEEHVAKHGGVVPLGIDAQPNDIAPCYVFLASRELKFITGQVLHPNGGTAVGS